MINGTLKDQQSFVRNKRKAECGTLRAGGLFCVYVWHTVSCQKSKNACKSVICAGQLKQVVERKLDNAQRLLSLLFLVCLLPYSVGDLYTIPTTCMLMFMFILLAWFCLISYLCILCFPSCFVCKTVSVISDLRAGRHALCCQAHFRWNIVKTAIVKILLWTWHRLQLRLTGKKLTCGNITVNSIISCFSHVSWHFYIKMSSEWC